MPNKSFLLGEKSWLNK